MGRRAVFPGGRLQADLAWDASLADASVFEHCTTALEHNLGTWPESLHTGMRH